MKKNSQSKSTSFGRVSMFCFVLFCFAFVWFQFFCFVLFCFILGFGTGSLVTEMTNRKETFSHKILHGVLGLHGESH